MRASLSLFFNFTAEMKYSLISVMEYCFGILTEDAPQDTLASLDFEPIILTPDDKCDFKIKLREKTSYDEFYLKCAAFALSVYFFKIRALPPHEITISHSVSNFSIDNADKISLEINKSKHKFTNSSREICGVFNDCYEFSDAVIFRAAELELFCEENLRSALFKESLEVKTALAFSFSEDRITIKCCSHALSLKILSEVLSVLDEEYCLSVGTSYSVDFLTEAKFRVIKTSRGRFDVYPEARILGFF